MNIKSDKSSRKEVPVIIRKPDSVRVADELIHMPVSYLSMSEVNPKMDSKRPVLSKHNSRNSAHCWVVNSVQVLSNPCLDREEMGVSKHPYICKRGVAHQISVVFKQDSSLWDIVRLIGV